METKKDTLKGKIALVTGGNSGIGFGAAKCLVEAGAFVYITGRKKVQLDQAQSHLETMRVHYKLMLL